MEHYGVFTKVVNVNIDPAPKYTFTANTPETVEPEVVSYYDALFAEFGCEVSKFEKIYYATDTASAFSLYLCIKKIQFNFVEMIPGQASRINARYSDAKPIVTTAFWNKMKEYDTLMEYPRQSGLLEKFYLYSDSPIPENYNEDYIVKLDFTELMDTFDDHILRRISSVFDISEYVELITPNNAMIATPGEGKMYSITKLNRAKLQVMYQLMMDYYLPTKIRVVSKPHPRRPIHIKTCKTGKLIDEIPEWFPIEYLPFYKKLHFEYLLQADDALIHKLDGRYNGKVILPTENFYRGYFFILMHRYFAALSLYDSLLGYKLKTFGIYVNAISTFAQNVINPYISLEKHNMKKFESNEFVMISNLQLKSPLPNLTALLLSASENSIILFVDVLNKFWPYDITHPELLDYFIIQRIEKEIINPNMDIISDTYTEYNFIFCKNKSKRLELLSLPEYTKSLPHTGINLKISFLNEQDCNNILQKIRIRALENYILNKGEIPENKGIQWDGTIRPLNENNYIK